MGKTLTSEQIDRNDEFRHDVEPAILAGDKLKSHSMISCVALELSKTKHRRKFDNQMDQEAMTLGNNEQLC